MAIFYKLVSFGYRSAEAPMTDPKMQLLQEAEKCLKEV
jgi:hypothetical protein